MHHSSHNSRHHPEKTSQNHTGWGGVAKWYQGIVGTQGHYYHQQIVIPGVKRLLQLQSDDSLVDFGCGQGIFASQMPKSASYLGIDVSSELITLAQKQFGNSNTHFTTKDLSKPLPVPTKTYSHALFMLSLQNISEPGQALQTARKFLVAGGIVVIVLNHPCFRIPRQSGWGSDPQTKQQFRWINRYLSPLKIPITMNPGSKQSQSLKTTWSFHHSLADYSALFQEAGFTISLIEEWTSNKESVGKAAKMENRARSEFPLFMAIKLVAL